MLYRILDYAWGNTSVLHTVECMSTVWTVPDGPWRVPGWTFRGVKLRVSTFSIASSAPRVTRRGRPSFPCSSVRGPVCEANCHTCSSWNQVKHHEFFEVLPSVTVLILQDVNDEPERKPCSSCAPNGCRPEALPRRVHVHHRALSGVAVDRGTIDQPQRVGLEVSSRRRVVVAHPVLVEAAFGLEPLAGEAGGGGRSGGSVDAAEGDVGGGPDLCARRVRRKHWPADVVSADEGDDAAFDHGDGVPAVPDILADQGGGELVVLGGAANRGRRREGTLGRLLRPQVGSVHGGQFPLSLPDQYFDRGR
jgi:hypothetical protein